MGRTMCVGRVLGFLESYPFFQDGRRPCALVGPVCVTHVFHFSCGISPPIRVSLIVVPDNDPYVLHASILQKSVVKWVSKWSDTGVSKGRKPVLSHLLKGRESKPSSRSRTVRTKTRLTLKARSSELLNSLATRSRAVV